MIENSMDLSTLNDLNPDERKYALKILQDIVTTGSSADLQKLMYEDYEEVPVNIEVFLHDKQYLGSGLINDEGKFTVFPYWEEILKKVFHDTLQPAAYGTLALSGAIGLGKSFVAVLCGLYELYRMLCLKDPYMHYGLQPIDKITFAFMNITIDAAKGVAWDKCQQLLQSSPWFLSRGTLSKSINPEWQPPKGIELLYGSQSRHIIGRAVYWCLDGDTEIATNTGDFKIKDLVDKNIQVYNITDNGKLQLSNICTVKPTVTSIEEYQIELEDGTLIKCTPEHRFMLKDGTYKEARYLTEDDDIFEFKPYGYIYKITNNVNNKCYIGKRVSKTFDAKCWGSGKLIKAAIAKYGKENFTREIMCWAGSKEELEELEKLYIDKFQTIYNGYNLTEDSTDNVTTNDSIEITNSVDERHVYTELGITDGFIKEVD